MDKDQILKLTEMSEDEQIYWLINHNIFTEDREVLHGGDLLSVNHGESLADLAFRLRSEVELYQWNCAIREIIEYLIPDFTEKEKRRWWIKEAKPIHWIIASLIAQSGEKK